MPADHENPASGAIPPIRLPLTHRWVPRLLRRVLRSAQENVRATRKVPGFAPSYRRVRPYTMISEASLFALASQVQAVVDEAIPGDLVECGVWRGGASFLMADRLQRLGERRRRVWMFDSFEGLPLPAKVDGPAAIDYARDTGSAAYLDNCRASIEEVREAAERLGLSERLVLRKGWFDQSLPAQREEIGPIALLRIDADWYASVRCCLDQLFDQVSEGGFVVFDDYYTWDGCAVAVHEFLAERKNPSRIEESEGCAFIRKRRPTP